MASMALNFRDHTSGFHHNEVISFTNSKILMNGGTPDFYVTFCSWLWNEVEDWLWAVLAGPQVS